MKNNILIPVLALIGMLYISIYPIKQNNKVDLAEELPYAQKGDTLAFYRVKDVTYINFYHKRNSYPLSAKLYIIK